jgi:hypothetical protein
MSAAVAFLVLWPLYGELYRHGGDKTADWNDLTGLVGQLRFLRAETHVFDTEGELSRFLSGAGGRNHQAVSWPEAESRFLLTTVGPRSSTGYELHVERVTDQRGRVLVSLKELTPQANDEVEARVTHPFLLLALPAGEKPVKVELAGRP